jgi:hypothetical protein
VDLLGNRAIKLLLKGWGMKDFFRSFGKFVFALNFFGLAVFCLAVTPLVFGQTSGTGALSGTVKDASGAVVPNATVTVTALGTNQARTATTGSDGTYKFGFLPPGDYSLSVEATGFKSAMVGSLTITVTETAVVDETLQVGAQSQQIEVSAEGETAVQTTGAAQGTVIGSQTVADMPLTVRNYTLLLGLSAGANATVANAGALGRGTQEIATNGLSTAQNNYSMDGASVVNPGGSGTTADAGGSAGMGVVNPDAIQEFKIQTSLYDAGYGRNPGASVNVVTKSGTNQWHGSAFEFFRNTALNANDFFRNQGTPPNNSRLILNENQYGGTFGGPIKKDKLFFFASYQETYQKNGVTILASGDPTLVPIPSGPRNTAAFQSALGATFCPSTPGTGGTTFQGGTQVSCTGANINPVALNLLNLQNPNGGYFIPSSLGGVCTPTGAAQTCSALLSSPAYFHEHQAIGNFDYVINSKNTLSGRLFIADLPQSVSFGCGVTGAIGATILQCLNDDPGTIFYHNEYANLKLTTLLTNNLVNEARISGQEANSFTANTGSFTNSQVGIQALYPGYIFTPGENPLMQITIAGKMEFGAALSLSALKDVYSWEAADQLSWSHGKHTIRFGGEIEHDLVYYNLEGVNLGQLTFETFQDFLIGLPGCPSTEAAAACAASQASSTGPVLPNQTNGSAYSNIYSGGSTPGSTLPGGPNHHYRNPDGDAFIQDDFKVTGNLTLSLGLRWEYDSLVWSTDGQEVDVWPSQINTVPLPGSTPATGTLAGFVVPANYNPSINAVPANTGILQNTQNTPLNHPTPKDNFAPRVGVAWRPFNTDKFVVRSGAGYFYDRIGQLMYATAIVQSVPYTVTLGAAGTANVGASFAQPYPYVAPSWTPRWVNINPATQTGSSSNLAVLFLDPNFTTPLTYEWNLDTQYEFASHWTLELAYVGSRSEHQPSGNFAYNPAQIVSPSDPYNGITTNTPGNANIRVPYLGFAPSGLTGACSCADSKFNSVQATVNHQFSHGLQMQAAYTWSRTLSDVNYFASNAPGPGNWGPSTYYHPQRLAITYSYQLPLGNHDGFVGKVANGWSVAGVTVVQDGTPLVVTDSRGGTIYGSPDTANAQYAPGMNASNEGTSGNDTARLGCSNTTTCTGWFNRAAFTTEPTIGTGTGWGDSAFGGILGPGQFNFDMNLQKVTKVGGIREDGTLVFRTEFFNIFNHPQFSNPAVVDFSKANFGQITSSSVNPRLIQFALKYQF